MKASEFHKRYIVNLIVTEWIDDKTAVTTIRCDGWTRSFKFKAIYKDRREIVKVLEDEDMPDDLVKRAVRIKKV